MASVDIQAGSMQLN